MGNEFKAKLIIAAAGMIGTPIHKAGMFLARNFSYIRYASPVIGMAFGGTALQLRAIAFVLNRWPGVL